MCNLSKYYQNRFTIKNDSASKKGVKVLKRSVYEPKQLKREKKSRQAKI